MIPWITHWSTCSHCYSNEPSAMVNDLLLTWLCPKLGPHLILISSMTRPSHSLLITCVFTCSCMEAEWQECHWNESHLQAFWKPSDVFLNIQFFFPVFEICIRGSQGHNIFISHIVYCPGKMMHYEMGCGTYHICVRHWTKTGHIDVGFHFCNSVCKHKQRNSLRKVICNCNYQTLLFSFILLKCRGLVSNRFIKDPSKYK